MRLINVHDYSMKEFYGHNFPAYAVLSHTWGDDEVLLSDMASEDPQRARAKKGFEKIEFCCGQARRDGWDWAWVDTCCIDKTSSAELSEAINSMFKWYSRAMVCYAYLVDVRWPGDGDGKGDEKGHEKNDEKDDEDVRLLRAVGKSRWFKRGWTLQELIAPIEVEFFDRAWRFLGSKLSWATFLEETTRIPQRVLRDAAAMRAIPVGLRMNWAFDRETTREEDMAYCLLGVFDINMPLLYGEGPRAFMRLQEEIMKHTDDHTLFLWDLPYDSGGEAGGDFSGLLAGSPRSFHTNPEMNTRDLPPECPWPLVSNRGVQIRFHLTALPHGSWARFGFEAPKRDEKGNVTNSAPRSVNLAALRCQVRDIGKHKLLPFGPAGDSIVALLLWQPEGAGSGVFYRKPGEYIRVGISEVLKNWKLTSCLILNSTPQVSQPPFYRGVSISRTHCKTRLVRSRVKGTWMGYLLSTTYKKGVLHTVIWLDSNFTAHKTTGGLLATRLPAWPSDEAAVKVRFQNASITTEVAREEARITKTGPGPAIRKVWVFENESLELVLTLVNEAYGATPSQLGSKLVIAFREIRR